jgi:LPS export ABC transporter protein LptC
VRLAGQPGADPRAAELHTPRMSLDTVSEIAETRSPVELAFGTHRIRAQGMRADLKGGTLRLESDVNGTFAP